MASEGHYLTPAGHRHGPTTLACDALIDQMLRSGQTRAAKPSLSLGEGSHCKDMGGYHCIILFALGPLTFMALKHITQSREPQPYQLAHDSLLAMWDKRHALNLDPRTSRVEA